MRFLNETHKENFKILEDRLRIGITTEVAPMIYILSGFQELMNKVDFLFDFKRNKPLYKVDDNGNIEIYKYLGNGEKNLVELGIYLWRGNADISLGKLFGSLDIQNRQLALNAIEIYYIEPFI